MNFANASKKAAVPPAQADLSGNVRNNDDAFDISSGKSTTFAMFICWVAVLASLAGTVFLWLLNNSVKEAIKSKGQEKTEIITEIGNPSLADTELRATAFKTAVTELSRINKSRYSLDEFLTKLYSNIAKNIEATNIAVTADGTISLSGKTVSYRAVADQMMLFKDWKVNDKHIIKDVQLMSTTQALNEETKKIEVTFLISGTIDKTQTLIEKPQSESSVLEPSGAEAGEPSDELSYEGGNDATIE